MVTALVQVLGRRDVRRPERPGVLAEAVRSMVLLLWLEFGSVRFKTDALIEAEA